jgi:3'-5' exoribonuclease
MKDTVAAIIKEIGDQKLQKVVDVLVSENEKAFYESPAACGIHHAFKGGLAVHLCNTARTALTLFKRYDKYLKDTHGCEVKKDLVIAGAFLHDIGKVKCYRELPTDIPGASPFYESTEESTLFHHIPIGFHMIASAIEKHCPDVPWKNELLHIIISHHGRVEWSSPKPPKTIEAFIVHQADYFDAHIDQWGKNPRKTEPSKDREGRKD